MHTCVGIYSMLIRKHAYFTSLICAVRLSSIYHLAILVIFHSILHIKSIRLAIWTKSFTWTPSIHIILEVDKVLPACSLGPCLAGEKTLGSRTLSNPLEGDQVSKILKESLVLILLKKPSLHPELLDNCYSISSF